MGWIRTLLAARRFRRIDGLFMTESSGNPEPTKRRAAIKIEFFGPDALERCERASTDLLKIIRG
jgi:hypothetical protein